MNRLLRVRSVFPVAAMAVLMSACRGPEAPRPVFFYTTPRVEATGLAEQIAAAFQHQSGGRIDLRVVTGEAIAAHAAEGGVALVSDPAVVTTLDLRQAVRLRSDIAVEDYAIVGPHADPARVKTSLDAVAAMRTIVQKKIPFCSPADVAPLADREHLLWSAATVNPISNRRYRRCRGSIASILRETAQLHAYTVVDAATAQRSLPRGLEVVMKDKPLLHDVYTLVLLRSDEPNPDAEWLMEWAMSYRGRDAVENFRPPSGRRFVATR